jgi:hypothetical protein
MHKIVFLSLLIGMLNGVCLAQYPGDAACRQHPLWIEMMNQEGVIFSDAVKAFETYYSVHPKPQTENERFRSSQPQQIKIQRDTLAFEYKKFMRWQQKMKAFVKPDGHVMNSDERLALWQEQLKLRK